jgi:hypothetical protein
MRKVLLLSGLALCLAALPALADNTIFAGSDVFRTAGDGNTSSDVSLPAGFFCSTSAAFSAHIVFVGVPFATNPADAFGATDTLIERLGDATFDSSNNATVNAIVRAVSFKGTGPVTVSGCPGSSLWDVKLAAGPTQSVFQMTFHRPSSTATGGTFDSNVSISPRLTFSQQGSSLQRTVDERPILFTTQAAQWTHQPGVGGVSHPGGSVQIDTDGNGVPDATAPPTTNFAAGWSPYTRTGCSTAPCQSAISHAAIIAQHLTQASQPFCKSTVQAARSRKLAQQQQQVACVARVDPATPVDPNPTPTPIDEPATPATGTTLNGSNN